MAERKQYEVQGIEFDVNADKLAGWKVFNMLKEARDADDEYDKVSAVMGIACYITECTEGEFVDKCGGEDAPVADIINVATQLIMAAYPKN